MIRSIITLFALIPYFVFTQSTYEWELPLNSIDVGMIMPIDDQSVIMTTVQHEFYSEKLGLKDLICMDTQSGEIKWQQPLYSKTGFIPLLTSPNLVGYTTNWFNDHKIESFGFFSRNNQGEINWETGFIATSMDLAITGESILAWSVLDGKWLLTVIDIPTGKAFSKDLQVDVNPLSTAVYEDQFFLFGGDQMVVYDSISSRSYQYPRTLNGTVSAVSRVGDDYLVAIGEMVFKWNEDGGLSPLVSNTEAVEKKYTRITQSLGAKGLPFQALHDTTAVPEVKGKKADEQLLLISRNYDSWVTELNLTGFGAVQEYAVMSHRAGEQHFFRLLDKNLELLGSDHTASELKSNLIQLNNKLYFTTSDYLFEWNPSSDRPKSLIPLGTLPLEPVELTVYDGQILVSGRTGFVLYEPNDRKISASHMVSSDFIVPSGYNAMKADLIASRLEGTGSVFRGQPVTISTTNWRARNVEFEQQIQREPYNRSFLVQQKSINTTIGSSFDAVYTASSLLGANMALMSSIEATRDREKLEEMYKGRRLAEHVVSSELASRIQHGFYLLPEYNDQGWMLNIFDLGGGTYATVNLASKDPLRDMNADFFFSYHLNEATDHLILKTEDENGTGYEMTAYYDRPKGFLAGKKTTFPFAKVVAVDVGNLKWKSASNALLPRIESIDERLINLVKQRDHEAVKSMLESGGNVDAQDALGMTPFLWSVALDDPDMVDLILKYDPDGGIRDRKGWTGFTYLEVLSLGETRAGPSKVTNRVKKGLK